MKIVYFLGQSIGIDEISSSGRGKLFFRWRGKLFFGSMLGKLFFGSIDANFFLGQSIANFFLGQSIGGQGKLFLGQSIV